ncbi:MAG: phage baseplate assembly protein V [Rickettsiales bacterium]|jgi:phage baseplate assembly protein V
MFNEQDGFILGDLGRRLANVIRIGSILEIDYELAKARVEIGDLETDWLVWINSNSSANNSWNPPQIGEQVVLLSPSGELNQAVILPSLYKNNAPENLANIQSFTYQDGSKVTMNHDDEGKGTLTLDLTKDMNINIGGNATITVVGDAKISAVNIDIEASGNAKIKAAGNADIEAPNISLTGTTTINGDTTVNGVTTLNGVTNLGGSGGAAVARIGDKVAVSGGSSAGQWPIIAGSGSVTAT